MNNNTTSTSGSISAPAGNAAPSLMGAMAPILLVIIFFYFLIIRPQQKREAKRQAMIGATKKGDKIVTTSGIIGVIHKIVSDSEISLEIAEGVRIRVLKNSIANVLDKKSELGKEIDEDEKKDTKKSKKNMTKTDLSPSKSGDKTKKNENS